jgi:hypothetical protein
MKALSACQMSAWRTKYHDGRESGRGPRGDNEVTVCCHVNVNMLYAVLCMGWGHFVSEIVKLGSKRQNRSVDLLTLQVCRYAGRYATARPHTTQTRRHADTQTHRHGDTSMQTGSDSISRRGWNDGNV